MNQLAMLAVDAEGIEFDLFADQYLSSEFRLTMQVKLLQMQQRISLHGAMMMQVAVRLSLMRSLITSAMGKLCMQTMNM